MHSLVAALALSVFCVFAFLLFFGVLIQTDSCLHVSAVKH